MHLPAFIEAMSASELDYHQLPLPSVRIKKMRPHFLPGKVTLGVGQQLGLVGALDSLRHLLLYQHWVVRPNDLKRLDAAFFQANGLLSVWLFAATALDVLRG
jgi:hypothetical protein